MQKNFQRTQITVDYTKKNIIQLYLKNQENYDWMAKAAALKPKEFYFILQRFADQQYPKSFFEYIDGLSPYR